MFLADIVKGKELSDLVIIEDDLKNNGRPLLQSFIRSLATRFRDESSFHIVMLEGAIDTNELNFLRSAVNRVNSYDFTKDPGGWLQNSGGLSIETTDIYEQLLEHQQGEKACVILDGISNLILHRSAAYTCQVLSRLSQAKERTSTTFNPIVCLLHRDLHDEHTLKMLHHIASTVLSLHPPKTTNWSGTCRILHKKLSGKVVRSIEEYQIGADFSIENCRDVVEIKAAVPVDTNQIDPAANLTFNLTLNESEKKARRDLHLPYMEHTKPKKEESSGEAKIFFQPDDADDFDEEDPDDDLDI